MSSGVVILPDGTNACGGCCHQSWGWPSLIFSFRSFSDSTHPGTRWFTRTPRRPSASPRFRDVIRVQRRGRPEGRRDAFAKVALQPVDQHTRALAGAAARDRLADAGRAARDDDRLVLEPHRRALAPPLHPSPRYAGERMDEG